MNRNSGQVQDEPHEDGIRGVGQRLLLAFAFIAVVSILTLIVANVGYRRVEERYTTVIDRTQPALVAAQELATECSRFEGTLLALDRAETPEELATARRIARAREKRLHTSLGALRASAATAEVAGDAGRLVEIVRRLEERDRSVAALAERRLARREEITDRTERLLRDLARLESDLEPLFMSLRERAAGAIEKDVVGVNEDLVLRAREVEGALAFELSLSALRAYVPGMLQASRSENLEAFLEGFRSEVRTMSGSLLDLAETPVVSRLATDLDEIVNDVQGEEGLVARLQADLDDRASAERARSEARVAVEEIEAGVTRIVRAAGGATRAAGERALSTVASARRSLFILTAISLLTMAAVMWFYVRGHVVRRLRQLRNSLHRLDRGDLETPVELDGRDELQEFAVALETLRRRSRELAATRDDLNRRNAELDQFVRVASHDLKSPLRAIEGLTRWVAEDEENLSEESRRNLATAQQRIVRMRDLIEDLLHFARLGVEGTESEIVDIGALLQGIIDFLEVPEGFRIEADGTLPRVRLVRPPFDIVLRNLVDNAMKHHDRPDGRVLVGAVVDGDRVRVRVEDDGPGIPPEKIEDAFRIFSRLSGPDRVRAQGSGVGLALVRKAVTEAGGSICVVPGAGRGARFEFDWPLVATKAESAPAN